MLATLGRMAAAVTVLAGTLTVQGIAQAAERVKVNTQTYAISGDTGAALYKSMLRQGPRRGLLSRAIAQTTYSVDWEARVMPQGNSCKMVRARPILSITYIYPKPVGRMPADLRRRWAAFMVGVKRHEEAHGALARQMAQAAEASVKGLALAGDPTCRKTKAEVKRRAGKIYAYYEERQRQFDAEEHRDKGNIDRLVFRLVKGK